MLFVVIEWSTSATDVFLSEELSITLPVSVVTDWVVSISWCVGIRPNANMSELAKIMIGIIKPSNLLFFFDKNICSFIIYLNTHIPQMIIKIRNDSFNFLGFYV